MNKRQAKRVQPETRSASNTTNRGRKRTAREDMLRMAVSLVKTDPSTLEPVDFMSEVALTFEALSDEMKRPGTSIGRPLATAASWKAQETGEDDSLERDRRWSKAS